MTNTDPLKMIAKKLLSRYLRLSVKTAGLPWTSDDDDAVNEIVDDIVDAACAQMAKQMAPLYPMTNIYATIMRQVLSRRRHQLVILRGTNHETI